MPTTVIDRIENDLRQLVTQVAVDGDADKLIGSVICLLLLALVGIGCMAVERLGDLRAMLQWQIDQERDWQLREEQANEPPLFKERV